MELNKYYKDLYLDALEYAGKTRESTVVADIAKAKRRVNDAYKNFLMAYDWYFLRNEALITTVENIGDYDLPEDFSIFKSKPFTTASNIYNYPTEIDNESILKLRSECSSTGTPYYFATTTKYTPEKGIVTIMRLYPTPSAGITYIYSYKPNTPDLVEDKDIPYCPPDLYYLLRAFVFAELEQFVEEDAKKGWISKIYQFLLPQAIKLDSAKRPSTVGPLSNMSLDDIRRCGRTFYNGSEI